MLHCGHVKGNLFSLILGIMMQSIIYNIFRVLLEARLVKYVWTSSQREKLIQLETIVTNLTISSYLHGTSHYGTAKNPWMNFGKRILFPLIVDDWINPLHLEWILVDVVERELCGISERSRIRLLIIFLQHHKLLISDSITTRRESKFLFYWRITDSFILSMLDSFFVLSSETTISMFLNSEDN